MLRIPRPSYLSDVPPNVRFEGAREGSPIPGPSYPSVEESNNAPYINIPAMVDSYSQNFGPDFLVAARGTPLFVFSSAAHVHDILVTKEGDFLKGDAEQYFSYIIGHVLLTDEGREHLMKRRAINHGVRGKVLDEYISSTREAFNYTLKSLEEDHVAFGFARRFSQVSAEAAMFGRENRDPDGRFPEAIQRINSSIRQGFRNLEPGALGAISTDLEMVRTHVTSLYSEWRNDPTSKTTLLDFLMESDPLSDLSQPDLPQTAFLLAAAIDTTTSLIASLIVCLHLHPEYRDRLEEEAREASKVGADFRALLSMTWHNAFINETLRLYPPFWVIPRIAQSDTEIGGFPIPRGSRVLVAPWLTHRNAEYFERPERFFPDRWVGLKPHEVDKKKYYPFGMGGRNCLGERQARLTATIFLSEFVLSGISVEGPPHYAIDETSSFLAPTGDYVLQKR